MESKQEEADKLKALFTKYFRTFGLIDNILKICKNQIMFMNNICYVTSTLNLCSGLLQGNEGKVLSDQEYEKIVLYSVCWALGGMFENAER